MEARDERAVDLSSDDEIAYHQATDAPVREVYVDAKGQSKFFDSQKYRCCFSLFHAKIGTFVLVTLVFHEIIIAMLYLLSRSEMIYRTIGIHFITVFISRLVQLLFSGVMYIALCRQRWKYIIPFALSQLTLGAYADVSTIIMIIHDYEKTKSFPLLSGPLRWLNYVIPLAAYFIFFVWFMYVLYRCCVYFHNRLEHEQRKKRLLDEENSDYSQELQFQKCAETET